MEHTNTLIRLRCIKPWEDLLICWYLLIRSPEELYRIEAWNARRYCVTESWNKLACSLVSWKCKGWVEGEMEKWTCDSTRLLRLTRFPSSVSMSTSTSPSKPQTRPRTRSFTINWRLSSLTLWSSFLHFTIDLTCIFRRSEWVVNIKREG